MSKNEKTLCYQASLAQSRKHSNPQPETSEAHQQLNVLRAELDPWSSSPGNRVMKRHLPAAGRSHHQEDFGSWSTRRISAWRHKVLTAHPGCALAGRRGCSLVGAGESERKTCSLRSRIYALSASCWAASFAPTS